MVPRVDMCEETRDDGRRRRPLATISAQILHVIYQNECECFIIGYKHRESIVSKGSDFLMKHEARVFDMASEMKQ